MTNDTSTLSGSLDEMKDQLISELGDKGVTATFDSSTGLLGLISKIGDIEQGSSGCPNLVTGTFTTANSNGTGSVSLSYNGNGYPIALFIYVDGGAYNDTSSGNTTWYNSVNRYDVGFYSMVKSRTTSSPTYATTGADNYGTVTIIYKNSTSTATQYTRTSTMTANTYTSSSTNASASTLCAVFKGNGKTLSYYIGNRGSSSIGLARNTTFAYIVIYSE
ncbi:MAG: hypothetical protein IJI96_03605 [Methanobrevibacter sp.]|nr:hypothetical protein [Methanobrevibacter sp.]